MDADPSAPSSAISLSLACLDDFRGVYLHPYSYIVPPSVDGYTFGVWSYDTEDYVNNQFYRYSDPTLTGDGAGIYITNALQTSQILTLVENAHQDNDPTHYLTVGMYDSDDDDDLGLWSDFDTTGLEDALEYLGCF